MGRRKIRRRKIILIIEEEREYIGALRDLEEIDRIVLWIMEI